MSKDFSKETISHLADLSKINLSDNEKEKLSNELNVIIDSVKKISELDLSNVDILINPIYLENVYRDDEIKESLSISDALKNAPNSENNQFKVAKIL